ncbi:hypothetical protein BJ508DRAFT_7276 [Ascobolus immersus RN42]|uniref:Uncharacterized protein n=1 Tax=Ascobolus immersus RN42 TaxID=1160509 RepID=A0A3N4IGS1_ASCIM|nr:hypothetical protein BJ508DRAFT_7276 [Ascobolus immersus RN42]
MSFRPATSILAQTRGAFALKATPRVIKTVRFSTVLPRYKESVSSGYGDDGSPASAHPKQQGAESEAHRKLEHPGPEPVSEGRPNTSKRDSPSYSSSFSGLSRGNERSNSPKINKGDSFGNESEDVKQHNANMGKREVDDDPKQEVSKSYWTGTTGNQ